MRERNPCTDCKRPPEEKNTFACKCCAASNAIEDLKQALYKMAYIDVPARYNCPYEEEPDEQSSDIRD